MKKKQIIMLIIALFFLISAITAVVYTFLSQPFEKIIIQTNATLTHGYTLGFNVATDALTFGQVPIEGTGKRYLLITNNLSAPITVKIYSTGNISPYLTANESSIHLSPHSEHNISIVLTPTTAEIGYYEGFITAAYYHRFIS